MAIDFKGLGLNTDLLDFSFNQEVQKNQFGTSEFRLDSETDFQDFFKKEDLDFIDAIKKANPIPAIDPITELDPIGDIK